MAFVRFLKAEKFFLSKYNKMKETDYITIFFFFFFPNLLGGSPLRLDYGGLGVIW